ncbi:hypothetical protein INF37_09480 [Pseudoflavonifractor sp. DSM 107456]|uniref:Uncharacterized protein n=2 Tax=Pseudoflavonifractor gallinarum TaxID=2779352 RepID=A0ABR9RC24_9FIRM|nr:hypothetical protein [Pseudoflavonifractor gallinarum]
MARVKEIISAAFPGEPIFVDRLPKDFQRPSFALELQKEAFADLNIALVQKTVTVLVTGFVAVNAYYDSSREELNRRQDRLMELFAGPSIRVDDRHPTVTANKGTGAPDFCEVQVTFSWSDTRPGYHDPDDMTDPVSASVPKIENYEGNINSSARNASGRTI